jgi:hypothetical protein
VKWLRRVLGLERVVYVSPPPVEPSHEDWLRGLLEELRTPQAEREFEVLDLAAVLAEPELMRAPARAIHVEGEAAMTTATAVAPRKGTLRKGTPSDVAKLKDGYEQLCQQLLDHPDYNAESFRQLQGDVLLVGDTLRLVLGEDEWAAYRQERYLATERKHGRTPIPTRRSSVTETRSSTTARPRIAPRQVDGGEELARELKERKRSLGSSWTITNTTIELSNPDYRDEVVLSSEARAAIEDAVYRSRISTLETGGPLGGHRSNRHRVSVTSARGAGSARRGFDWIKLGGELHRFEQDVEDTPGVDLVGCWHSHPSGRAKPSEADMIAWARMLDGVERRHGTSTYIGMIAEPSPNWRSGMGRMAIPTLHAWLVRRVSPSLVTCERADVSP